MLNLSNWWFLHDGRYDLGDYVCLFSVDEEIGYHDMDTGNRVVLVVSE
jgi:hypothetical protein